MGSIVWIIFAAVGGIIIGAIGVMVFLIKKILDSWPRH
jgi:hypothetical protein